MDIYLIPAPKLHGEIRMMSFPEVIVVRSRRKTVSIEITADNKVLIRAPLTMSSRDISFVLEEKKDWIAKHLRKRSVSAGASLPSFSKSQLKELAEQARVDLPQRTAHYADLIGVRYGRITIRAQRTRWGSCSSLGNLNFNCLTMLCPEKIRNYIVVHELCHLKHMDHSPAFWALVARYIPDYKECRRWLRSEGSVLIERLRRS